MRAEDIVKKLKLCEPGLSKSSYEIEEHASDFIFHNNAVITYNGAAWVSCDFEVEGLSCMLPGIETFKFFSGLKGIVRIKDRSENIEVLGRGIKAKIKKKKISDEVFEGIAALREKRRYRELPKNFSQGLAMCGFSFAFDATIPALTCLYISGNKMVTSDDLRISEFTLAAKMPEFLIPGKIALQLLKYSLSKYSVGKSWVFFRGDDNVIFACRRISGDYPSIKEHFNFSGATVTLPAKRIREALKLASVFVSEEMEVDKFIDINIDNGMIKVSGEGEAGKVEKKIKCVNKIKRKVNFKVNPNFLDEVLKKANKLKVGSDRALFSINNFRHLMVLK